jgi:hypothetical protein
MIRVPYVVGRLSLSTAIWASVHDDARMVELDGRDEAYHEALCEWWRSDGDLVIVEQDVLPADGVVEEMLVCPSEWCVSPYPIFSDEGEISWDWSLGCTKFSGQLRDSCPEAAELAGLQGEHEVDPPRCWWMLDVRLACVLARVGALPHAHRASRHLHPYPALEEVR